MAVKREGPSLPCPECRMRGKIGAARIGTERIQCPVCNRFAQAAIRKTYRKIREMFPDECEALRLAVELELYPAVMAEFDKKHPRKAAPDA